MNGTAVPNVQNANDFIVTPQRFSRLIEDAGVLKDTSTIAVAVSGGPDSMALLTMLAEWVGNRGVTLNALTVDHGLRSESAWEAAQVAGWCGKLGIAHTILPWLGEKPGSGIQEAARKARYRLLEGWCNANGCGVLFLGHTMNDQAETFLMRMNRGSGVDGLAGMPLVSFSDGVRIIRPLLSISKERLKATLSGGSVGWIEDPSNTDGRFSRVAIRRQLDRFEGMGISIASVAGAARIFGQLRADAENDLRNLADRCVVLHPTGFADIQTAKLRDAPEELKANLISVLLTLVGGRNYRPRRLSLGRLMDRLNSRGDWTGTLAGCVISPRQGVVRIIREHKAAKHVLPVKPGLAVWDNRFILTVRSSIDDDLEIRALGEKGWQAVSNWPRETSKFGFFAKVPGPVRFGLPAIWRGQNIVEAPHFGLLDPQLPENIVKSVNLRCRAPLTAPPFWVA